MICPDCHGEGQLIVGENFITHEMALDAGEPQMEGMHHSYVYDKCPRCEGGGLIEDENKEIGG